MKGLGLLSAPLDDQGLTTQHYSLFNETKCTFISSSYVSNLTMCRFWREQRGLRGLLCQQHGQESCRRGEDRRREGQERRSRGGECRPHNCHFFLHKYNLWYLWQIWALGECGLSFESFAWKQDCTSFFSTNLDLRPSKVQWPKVLHKSFFLQT